MDTERTFQNILDYWGEKTPEREAVYDGFRRITYGELKEESRQLAIALSQLNIQKGDKVLINSPFWYEYVVLFYALAKLGAILVSSNIRYTEMELKLQLGKIRPKVVFLSSPCQLNWLKDYNQPCTVITVRFEEEGYRSFANLLHAGKNGQLDTEEIDPVKDVSTILFTSGTTGNPKGVELTYKNLLDSAVKLGCRLKCTDQDISLVPLPVDHLFGMLTGMIIPLYFGGRVILIQKYNPQQALALIEEEKVTIHHGVPTMFIKELQENKQYKKNVTSLRTGIVAGAACPEKIFREICTDFHCDIMVLYGLTEAGAISMSSFQDSVSIRSQTVGRTFEGVQIKVIDETEGPEGLGKVGELVCKGSGVMKGYHQMPAETEQAFDEKGWFYTGDLVTVDSSGYIRIAGRKKEMIIRGGFNIYPAEVEKVYNAHPSVLEVCVLGFPHEILGEQTYAFITLKDNSAETKESLREYAKGKIVKCKIPDQVVLLDEMPRLANGKIDKKALRRQ